ncbi:MAG: hypothetical protein E7429_06535 [Ruminococcaceae bacterium]|nr:hypothetical protein [Oscillospiraceae bacterium]
MPEETDYKKACEILRAAVKDAERILRKAALHISLLLDDDLQNSPDETVSGESPAETLPAPSGE